MHTKNTQAHQAHQAHAHTTQNESMGVLAPTPAFPKSRFYRSRPKVVGEGDYYSVSPDLWYILSVLNYLARQKMG